MSERLKPCPFCGAKLELVGQSYPRWQHPVRNYEEARCPAAGFSLSLNETGDSPSRDAWDRRSTEVAASPDRDRVVYVDSDLSVVGPLSATLSSGAPPSDIEILRRRLEVAIERGQDFAIEPLKQRIAALESIK